MKRSTLLHLRIPFSFFLLPVFLFAWSIFPETDTLRLFSVFFILHFLVYPASNGYNSYFDKDEDSIGGLREPPKVAKELYYYSLVLDGLALIWAASIDLWFAAGVLVYGLVSKAYSHPRIRLKKMPYAGWLAAGFFQGYFTFIIVLVGLHGVATLQLTEPYYQIPAVLSTMLLFGSYPMTQVYQHAEDGRRGDLTISRILGIKGTFHFTAAAFAVSTAGFAGYYYMFHSLFIMLVFLLALAPVLLFFSFWYLKVRKDLAFADFANTMRLNMISSLCLNLFFVGAGIHKFME